MKLIPVEPENLKLAWKDVGKYIEDGIQYTDANYAIADVLEMIKSGLLILWVVYNEDKEKAAGCLLTQLYQYPRNNVLSIFLLCVDDFEEAAPLLEDVKEYAKGLGCKKIEFYGRSGWEKMLKSLQFEKIYTVMRLNI